MRNTAAITVIIPALNEQASIARVLDDIPGWVDEVIVADNGSTDRTAAIAAQHGARVVHEPRRGYGSACLKAMASMHNPDVVVFLDADYSDYPEEMASLVDPIERGETDMVIGSRVLGRREVGALTPQARFGNWLSCLLLRWFWNVRYTDLGPFRAIAAGALAHLRMRDPDYGWTVEMQVKAAKAGFSYREVPVSYRKRIGRSKVSGTVRGVIGAGTKILGTIFLEAFFKRRHKAPDPALLNRLIVYTRYPQPGKTKTRLIRSLGAAGAADLQKQMTEHTLDTARRFCEASPVACEIRHEGGDEKRMRQWVGESVGLSEQGAGDLGARMLRSFRHAFHSGAHRAVTIGTDCPELSQTTLATAFSALCDNDLVIGPSMDGGYYLIGLRRPVSALFETIDWGTDQVLEQTVRIADRSNLRTAFLEKLTDVDRPEDLPVWERAKHRRAE